MDFTLNDPGIQRRRGRRSCSRVSDVIVHGSGHDRPDALLIMNYATGDQAQGKRRAARAVIMAGRAWIGFALATSMRQYGAFMASGRHALPERTGVRS